MPLPSENMSVERQTRQCLCLRLCLKTWLLQNTEEVRGHWTWRKSYILGEQKHKTISILRLSVEFTAMMIDPVPYATTEYELEKEL